MKALVRINNHKRANSIHILFSPKAIELIDSNEILILKTTEGLIVKRPTMESKKTFKLTNKHGISHSFYGAKDLIGDYWIDDENIDEFTLNKIN